MACVFKYLDRKGAQMAKGSDYGAHNKTLSFTLSPSESRKLRQNAQKHGGVGRAIHVAAELLKLREKLTGTLRGRFQSASESENENRVRVSFTVPKRTFSRFNHWCVRYGQTRNAVLSACVAELGEIDEEDYFMDPAFRPPEGYDPDEP
jgi:hypothetical protein